MAEARVKASHWTEKTPIIEDVTKLEIFQNSKLVLLDIFPMRPIG